MSYVKTRDAIWKAWETDAETDAAEVAMRVILMRLTRMPYWLVGYDDGLAAGRGEEIGGSCGDEVLYRADVIAQLERPKPAERPRPKSSRTTTRGLE